MVTVYDTVRRAVERARAGQGISIIEAVSMRLDGHSIADPFETYVPDEQLAQWRERTRSPRFGPDLLVPAS